MGYEKPSTKLTFYKAFFPSQWKFLIYTIMQSMSAKRTSWNEFSSAMAFAVICLSTGKGFSWVKTPLFEGMIVEQVIEELKESILSSRNHKAKEEGEKAGNRNKVRVLKLRRLKKVGTSQRIDTSEDTVMDDASNQRMIIDDLDKDDVVALMDDKEEEAKVVEADQVQGRQAESQAKIYKINVDHALKVLSMQEDKPAEVQEVVDVVTTVKLITEVVTAASEIVTAASTINSVAEPQVPAATITAASVRVAAASTRRRKRVAIRDPEEELTTIIPVDTKSKDKGKGIMIEEPKPLKKKQQVEMDEEYARKLHVELNKDIDRDVAVDHVKQKEKEDPAVQRYQAMKRKPQTEAQGRRNMIMYLKNLAAFRLDYFKDRQAQVWKNQRIVHGQAKVKSWKLLESCGVHIITFTTTQLILLVERRYPLSRFTLDQMLNAVRLRVEEESEMSLELLRFTRQQHQEGLSAAKQKMMLLDSAAD
nr:hypothetical protein [Tanacetum cinerariifolium]